MNLKIRRIGNGYGVLFPRQLMEEMHLTEGSVVQVEQVGNAFQMVPYDEEFAEALRAFRETAREHRNSYRELAK